MSNIRGVHSGTNDNTNNNNGANGPSNNPFAGVCTNCIRNTPAMTRVLTIVILAGTIAGLITVSQYTSSCIQPIVESSFLQFYRIFVSQFFAGSIIGGIFGIVFLWQIGASLERYRGSMFLLHAFLICGILTNIATVLWQAVLLYGAKWDYAQGMCSVGVWPALFSLIAIENVVMEREERPFLCCPTNVPSKFYPWLLLLMFSLMLGISPIFSLLFGLLVGLAYIKFDKLHLSTLRARSWESFSALQWLVNMPSFITAEAAAGYSVAGGDAQNPWGFGAMMGGGGGGGDGDGADRDGNERRTYGGGASGTRAMTINDLPDDEEMGASPEQSSTTSASTTPSVFTTGSGYRLDGSTTSSTKKTGFSIPFLSSSSSASSSSSSSSSSSANRSAAVDRLARLAKSSSPSGVDSSSSSSSSSSAAASAVDGGDDTMMGSHYQSRVPAGTKQHGDYVELSNTSSVHSAVDEEEEAEMQSPAPFTPWNPHMSPPKS